MEKIINFVKSSIFQILIVIYFVRYLFPQGIYSLTLTAFFYYSTEYLVVSATVIAGLIGVVRIIKSSRKNIEINPRHRSYLLAAIIGLIFYSISFITHNNYFHMKFDAELWRNTKVSMNSDANALTLRQRMMEDLIEHHLIGLTKTEVEFLLGVPHNTWQSDNSDWSFLYVVGPERGLGADSHCLVIHFDMDNLYQSYEDIQVCG